MGTRHSRAGAHVNYRGIEYTVRGNPRARRITLTVRRDGSVRVTKPKRATLADTARFVRESSQWIERMKRRFESVRNTSSVEPSKTEYKKYKKEALLFVQSSIRHMRAPFHGKIFIRNQKSRWGSCSHNGNLSFNYRILFLPPYLAAYVVVHELCHLREMNHSRAFWSLVAKEIPDYASRRKALRQLGHTLLID
ncbi:MAG: M48 family metallopeptidase [Patescibacteria group bacterium]|nr:M48 family metallopeptidase [Patescibacteria group bacterium]